MHVKGLKKFQEKIPAFSGKKIFVLPLYVFSMSVLAFLVYFFFNSLPGEIEGSGISGVVLSFSLLLGVITMEIAGFALVWQLWLWRDRLKKAYGDRSFQRIFLFGLAGITWILTITVNQYVPFFSFAREFWASSPFQFLATPLQSYIGNAGLIIFYIKNAFALALLGIGLTMIIRALQVFGIDYMVVLYVYFPKEGRIQKNEIYSALRHPTYAGALLICLGGSFFTFTIFSFTVYLALLAGFYIHIHFFEEKELLERFGNSYRNYRKNVPAFFINPMNLTTLFRFLVQKDRNIQN